ncbi:hypothetical protein FF38_02581 [Lucilia cuprina]|uniref:Uncharacterized protein n=1 Tax=Lucilia cuprina TaxID=7375 RepID=A0A0L0CBK9_LUCCU|nr:hypothetical protein FF38_02581 [Lucilia cuprina]
MAEKTTEKPLKRKRINGTHRWTDAKTLHLVQEVAEEVKDKIESYEYLEQIFGQRRGVNPLIIIETSMEDRDIDCVVGEVEILSSFIDKEEFFETSENNTSSSPETSFSSQTSIDSISLKESMKKIPKKTPKSKNTSPFSMLISLQEKKLEIEGFSVDNVKSISSSFWSNKILCNMAHTKIQLQARLIDDLILKRSFIIPKQCSILIR